MQNTTTSLAIALATGLLSASTAFAQQPAPAQVQKAMEQLESRFAAADTNKDGCVTKDEANGKMPRVYQNFETIDKEKKGCVTLAAIKSSVQEHAMDAKAARQK